MFEQEEKAKASGNGSGHAPAAPSIFAFWRGRGGADCRRTRHLPCECRCAGPAEERGAGHADARSECDWRFPISLSWCSALNPPSCPSASRSKPPSQAMPDGQLRATRSRARPSTSSSGISRGSGAASGSRPAGADRGTRAPVLHLRGRLHRDQQPCRRRCLRGRGRHGRRANAYRRRWLERTSRPTSR